MGLSMVVSDGRGGALVKHRVFLRRGLGVVPGPGHSSQLWPRKLAILHIYD